jgi:hypothetical protein
LPVVGWPDEAGPDGGTTVSSGSSAWPVVSPVELARSSSDGTALPCPFTDGTGARGGSGASSSAAGAVGAPVVGGSVVGGVVGPVVDVGSVVDVGAAGSLLSPPPERPLVAASLAFVAAALTFALFSGLVAASFTRVAAALTLAWFSGLVAAAFALRPASLAFSIACLVFGFVLSAVRRSESVGIHKGYPIGPTLEPCWSEI